MNVAPGSGHQQGIGGLEFLVHQHALQRLALAAQADHVEFVLRTKAQFLDGLARQLRLRRQRHFGKAQFMGVQAEIRMRQRHGLEAQGLVTAEQADGGAGDIHQQHVARFQQGIAVGHQQQGAQALAALDGDDVDAMITTQLQFVEYLIGQGRVGAYLQAPFALAQAIALGQIGQGQAWRLASFTSVHAYQPTPGDQHVADAEQQHRQANGGEIKKAKTIQAGAAQFGMHHQVWWCGDQRQHAADQAGEGQWHHQSRRGDAQARSYTEHHGDEDRHHTG